MRTTYAIHASAISLLSFALLCSLVCACAGELEKPERFAEDVRKYTNGDVSGTGGQSPPPPPSTTDEDAGSRELPACAQQLFKKTCGLAGCHAKGSAQLDLVSAGVEERLIDQQSEAAVCQGRTYVATDGSSSLLLDKLTASPPCGSRMPVGGKISAAEEQCLTDWVDSLSGGESDAGAKP